MKNVHLISHTHWDREWYFTVKDSYVLISETFKRVVDDLEQNNCTYILDAQSSILEDFINFVPSYRKRTEKLIESGRLIVGPWYTQTDCNYVGAESIIQNIKLGQQLASKYGGKSTVAYLPDTFGFNMQMPSILKACSINEAVIRRGLDYEYHKTGPYFNWEALNGDQVRTIHLYKGYGELGHVSIDKKNKLENYIDLVSEYSHENTNDFVCLCGGDQTEINPNHTKVIESLNNDNNRKYKYLNSSFEQLFKNLSVEDYGFYQGDLRLGRYDRVHRSIGSSRYDIKTENYRLENYIFKVINPLIAIASEFNIDIEVELVNYCIKKLAENQAHDSMGGCVTDEVYEDIMYRFKEVREILDGIKNVISYRMHEILGLNDNQIIIFNTSATNMLLHQNVEVLSYSSMIRLDIKHEILDVCKVPDNSKQGYHNIFTVKIDEQIPTLGFKVSTFEGIDSEFEKCKVNHVNIGDLSLELVDGDLQIIAFGKKINNFIRFYDQANDGDTYDFSPLRDDEELVFSKPDYASIETVANNALVNLEYNLLLPSDLKNRISKEQFRNVKINVRLLVNDNNGIKAEVLVDNTVLSHRLRIGFATNIHNDNHIKSIPFTSVVESDCELNIVNFEQQGFVEENLNLKVMDNAIVKADDQLAVTVKSSGLKEYQVNGEELIVTLFSTTSQFGKGNLLSRPGRASGDTERVGHKMIPTPQAEYIGENKFSFDIEFSACTDEDKIAKFIDKTNANFVGYQMQIVDKFRNRLDNKLFDIDTISKSMSKFSLLRSDLVLQNIEKFGAGYLIRVENPGDTQILQDDHFEGLRIIKQTDVFGIQISEKDFTANSKTCSTFYVEGDLC